VFPKKTKKKVSKPNYKMKILIVEDEKPAADRLIRLILEIDPTAEILDTVDSVEATLNYLAANAQPDLLLMDIHLADGSCFEIFKYENVEIPVIFTTAYDEYALQAFKTNALDYLMKPIKQTELAAALTKFGKLSTANRPSAAQLSNLGTPQYSERFLIKTGQSYRIVELREVAYFMSEDKISYAIKVDGKRTALDFTMDKLETMLSPKTFFRLNRQFIVSASSIAEMVAYSKSRVKVKLNPKNKEEPVVSSERTGEFKRWLING
jgi:DNA-binding LytR/AlgR family response regulator